MADAFERAVGALAQRERTVAELEGWLEQRSVSPAEIAEVIDRLVTIGELDDERFARRYAEDKRELSGWGSGRIRAALADKGVDRELIDAALQGTEGDGGELERAIELLERRGEAPADERRRGRALAFLARRGYERELAYEAVRGFERRCNAG